MINYYHGATLALFIITLNPSGITTRVSIKFKGLYGIANFEGHRVIPAMQCMHHNKLIYISFE